MAQEFSSDSVREILQSLSMMPGIGDIVRQFLNSTLGTPPYGLSWTGINPYKSLPWNVAAAERSRFIRSATQDALLGAIQRTTQNTLTNLYRLGGQDLGMAEKSAQAAAQGVLGQVAALAFAPQLQAASSRFGMAAYRRLSVRDVDGYQTVLGKLWEGTLSDASEGRLAGLSSADAGIVLSEMIGGGVLERGGKSVGAMNTRIERIKKDLVSYAHSVGVLKDIIDGPVEEIMRSFEALTGNKLTSMAPGRAAVLAGSMRNVAYSTGATYKQMVGYTARQYGLIAPYGGTIAQANAMAMSTIGAVRSGYQIEGLSETELGDALAQSNARKFISGQYRRQAAVYVHWRQSQNLEDNVYTREAFRQAEVNTDDYIRRNNLSSAFFASKIVTDTMASPMFSAVSQAAELGKYKNRLRRMDIRNFTGKVSESTIRRILENNYDESVMHEELVNAGMDINQAAELVRRVGGIARGAFNTSNAKQALGMAATAENGLAIQRRQLGNYALQQLRGERLEAGWGGIFSFLAKNPRSNLNIGVASLLSTWLSGDPKEAYKLEGTVRQLLAKGDEAGLRALLNNSIGADNAEAIIRGDWGKSNAFIEVAQMQSARGADGRRKLDGKALIARKRLIMDAVRSGEKITFADIDKLADGTTLDERTRTALFMESQLGPGVEAAQVDQFMKFSKEAKGFLLKQKGWDSKKNLNAEEKAELANATADFALARVRGRSIADRLRWTDSGSRRTVEETMEFLRKNWTPDTGELWEHAAATYNKTVGKDGKKWDALKQEEQEAFIRKQFVERGGIEELLAIIISKIDQWIRSNDEAAKNKDRSRGG